MPTAARVRVRLRYVVFEHSYYVFMFLYITQIPHQRSLEHRYLTLRTLNARPRVDLRAPLTYLAQAQDRIRTTVQADTIPPELRHVLWDRGAVDRVLTVRVRQIQPFLNLLP